MNHNLLYRTIPPTCFGPGRPSSGRKLFTLICTISCNKHCTVNELHGLCTALSFSIKKKIRTSNFTKIRPVEVALFHADGQTAMSQLTVAFCDRLVNAPKICTVLHIMPQYVTSLPVPSPTELRP